MSLVDDPCKDLVIASTCFIQIFRRYYFCEAIPYIYARFN